MFPMRILLLLFCWALSGCALGPASLAPVYAEPKTRPARNFTSFDGPLRCMDQLLAKKRRGTIALSSTGIPDQTGRIRVAGDDMLINALNRMTRNSRAYVFLDQELVRDGGLIDLIVAHDKDAPRPSYYVRGAISQLDGDVGSEDLSIILDEEIPRSSISSRTTFSGARSLDVVSVDLHLVHYPSRRVVPGASVSNSMVVRDRSWGGDAFGLISMTGVDVSLQVDRIESPGQAVRNLIELSMIELIGKHSGVPYWTCLASPSADANLNSQQALAFSRQPRRERVRNAQRSMAQLGRFEGPITGRLDGETRKVIARFQADENLLVNGIVDFDTMVRLRERVREAALAPVEASPKRQKVRHIGVVPARPAVSQNTASQSSGQSLSSEEPQLFVPLGVLVDFPSSGDPN